jgi:hypothetical protein
MGYGDEIMLTGRAAKMRHEDQTRSRKIVVIDAKGLVRQHEVFGWCDAIATLPRDATDWSPYQVLLDGPGYRPYVDREAMIANWQKLYPGKPFQTKKIRDPRLPWVYSKTFRPIPGVLDKVTSACIQFHGSVVLQPYLKPNTSPNKQWPLARWQQVADALRDDYDLVMIGPRDQQPQLDGVRHHITQTFWEGLIYLAGCRTAVLPDGGMQHGMAALGIPATVIYGGFTSALSLGYDLHSNLQPDMLATPCGQWVTCAHCKGAMRQITVPDVVESAIRLANNADRIFT